MRQRGREEEREREPHRLTNEVLGRSGEFSASDAGLLAGEVDEVPPFTLYRYWVASPIKKGPSPQDPPRTLGIGLR